jgi:hypothetical protein
MKLRRESIGCTQTGGRWPGAAVDLGGSPGLSGSRLALVAAEQSAKTFGLDDFTCTAAITRSG